MVYQPGKRQVANVMAAAAVFAASLPEDVRDDHAALMLALDSETPVLDMLRAVVTASIEASAMAASVGERIDALTARRQRYRTRHDSLRQLALQMLQALEQDHWEFPEFTLTVSTSHARPVVTDVDALPEHLVRVTRKPDMPAIFAASRASRVPGTEARNGSPTLTVRTR